MTYDKKQMIFSQLDKYFGKLLHDLYIVKKEIKRKFSLIIIFIRQTPYRNAERHRRPPPYKPKWCLFFNHCLALNHFNSWLNFCLVFKN